MFLMNSKIFVRIFLLRQFCVICLPLISNCATICLTPTIAIMVLITTNGVYVGNIPLDSTSGELESHFVLLDLLSQYYLFMIAVQMSLLVLPM